MRLSGYRWRSNAAVVVPRPRDEFWVEVAERGGNDGAGNIAEDPSAAKEVELERPQSELLTRHFGTAPHPFGKRVVGVAGDRVTERDRRFFINGRAVALAKPASRRGEPLALGPTGIIPRGCYFVATEHKDSFDSRYAAIGWICRPRVLGVGRPVL